MFAVILDLLKSVGAFPPKDDGLPSRALNIPGAPLFGEKTAKALEWVSAKAFFLADTRPGFGFPFHPRMERAGEDGLHHQRDSAFSDATHIRQ